MGGDTGARQPSTRVEDAGRSFRCHRPRIRAPEVGDACQAFLRAFRRRPLLERARIRQEELARLEYLRTVVQSRSDLTAEHMQRRLRAIQGMRDAILAD